MRPEKKTLGLRVALLALSPFLVGCGGGPYSSPEACAVAAKTALDEEDMGGVYDCLTERSKRLVAGRLVSAVAAVKMMSGLAVVGGVQAAIDAKEKMAPLEFVLDQHGVSEETLRSVPPSALGGDDEAAVASLAAAIGDKRQFVVDMFKALEKWRLGSGLRKKFSGTFKGIKVDGNRAVATLTDDAGEQHVNFTQTAEGWKLELDLDALRGP